MAESSDHLMGEVSAAVLGLVQRAAAARETAVEMAVQSGVCGVREVRRAPRWSDGGDMTWTVDFEVTPEVPYGHIYVVEEW